MLERADLQRLLRARIDAIANDVLIVAEEFGAFTDAKRRIDLLGVDRGGWLSSSSSALQTVATWSFRRFVTRRWSLR